MFLDKKSIEAITGYKIKSKQVQWLRRSGIRFTLNRAGDPLVLQKHIEEILCDNPTSGDRRIEPDEAALRKTIGLR